MAKVIVKLSIRLPWWWRGYVRACAVIELLGFPLDPEKMAKVIIDHTKFGTQ